MPTWVVLGCLSQILRETRFAWRNKLAARWDCLMNFLAFDLSLRMAYYNKIKQARQALALNKAQKIHWENWDCKKLFVKQCQLQCFSMLQFSTSPLNLVHLSSSHGLFCFCLTTDDYRTVRTLKLWKISTGRDQFYRLMAPIQSINTVQLTFLSESRKCNLATDMLSHFHLSTSPIFLSTTF